MRARAQACWFTNLDFAKRHEDLILYKKYSPEEYPTYDNFDAIEVARVENIPVDYDGLMGVPISFLDKHNPTQFEIFGSFNAGTHGEDIGAKDGDRNQGQGHALERPCRQPPAAVQADRDPAEAGVAVDIKLTNITVRELTSGYEDNAEEGVVGFDGQLDIRPAYQREFIYKDRQRDAVIETVRKGFPLNVMYWAVRNEGGFELIDGQQRTISICQYVDGDFSVGGRYFYNLQDDEQDQILDYELAIYRCTGTNSEKLDWFQTINIAGEKLTPQELRNAIFHGPWVSDAKRISVRLAALRTRWRATTWSARRSVRSICNP